MKNVLVYRCEVLSPTQTFVLAQTSALKRYRPRYTGLRRHRQSLPINDDPILLSTDSSVLSEVKSRLYQMDGLSPSFHKRARNAEPALVHVHFAEDGTIALPLVRALDAPMIVTLHGSVEPIADRFMVQKLRHVMYLLRRRQMWEQASTFLCVSEFMRKAAAKAGYPENKLRVHYVGIECDRFTPGNESRQDGLVLFVGRLAEKKGAKYLIDAMSIVQKRHPGAELVIIGDGPERESLEVQASELGISCRFLGLLSTAEILEWLRVARVFCGPSTTGHDGNSEGLGMVFAEAQAVGLPVVSFEHGGVPEVVRHGETGLLAKERDRQELAEHILTFLSDDGLWHKCSERAKTWIRERFNIQTQTAELESIYDGIV
jgi:colanic acid/amylovoran biosynthesis glycosyltransferase